jgi:hypothetical protein
MISESYKYIFYHSQQAVIINNFYKADFTTITTACNKTKLFCPKSNITRYDYIIRPFRISHA